MGNLTELVLLLQRREESMKAGFTVVHNELEYDFYATFVDR